MTIFFTSDTHFGHKAILQYCNRPFKTIEEMDEVMIVRWNNIVKKHDEVYNLGDFSFYDTNKTAEILSILNGYKILVNGSHDKKTVWQRGFINFGSTYMLKYNHQNIFMSHYLHKIWPLSHYGSWHLCGHSHSTMNEYISKEGKILDVGVDSHNFTPWSLEEIIEVMKTRPANFNLIKKS